MAKFVGAKFLIRTRGPARVYLGRPARASIPYTRPRLLIGT